MDNSTKEHFSLFFKQVKRKELSNKDEYGIGVYSPFVHWYGTSQKNEEDDIFLMSEGGSRLIEAILCQNIVYDRYEDGLWLEHEIKLLSEQIEKKAKSFISVKPFDVYFWKKTGYMIEWDLESFEQLGYEEKVDICRFWLEGMMQFSVFLKKELKKSLAIKTSSI